LVSFARSRGLRVSGENVYGIRQREAWQKQLACSVQTRAVRLYAHLDFLLEQKDQAETDLLREAKKHPIVRILETVSGFGPIRAAQLVPIVVTPHRFRTKRQFWSYCGLGIAGRQATARSAESSRRQSLDHATAKSVRMPRLAWPRR
jgi:transposase